MTRDEVLTAMFRAGRCNAPAVLWDAWTAGDVAGADLPYLTCHAWAVAEYPANALDLDDWRCMFGGVQVDGAGRLTLTRDGVPIPVPTVPMRLYRGAPPAQAVGMSWTTSRTVAEAFAHDGYRGRQAGRVWAADVAPDRVLALIQDARGEDEVVIDPTGLEVQEVDQ